MYGDGYGQPVGGYDYGAAPRQDQALYGPAAGSGWGLVSAPQSYGATDWSGGDAWGGGMPALQEAPLSPIEKYFATQAIRDANRDERDRVKGKERRNARRSRSKLDAVYALLIMSGLSALCWIISILGNSWQSVQFAGIGFAFLEIQASATSLHVTFHCHKERQESWLKKRVLGNFQFHAPENWLCHILEESLNGRWSLQDAKATGCLDLNLMGEPCMHMTMLFYSNCFLIFGFVVAAVFQILAAICLYYYWFVEPLQKIRHASGVYFSLAPSIGISSYLIWTFITPDLTELPRSYTNSISSFGPLAQVLRINRADSMPFGWTFFFAVFTAMLSIATIMVWGTFLKPHDDERKVERARDRIKEGFEEKIHEMEIDQVAQMIAAH